MKVANQSDSYTLALLLKDMYFELDSDSYVEDLNLWLDLANLHIKKDTVLIDSRGFFILRDETLPVHKEKVWNGVAVYVKPEFRNSKALKDYYKFMFSNFKGTILGFTEINSLHNKVLLKRHKLVGYVYVLNRPA